MILEMILELYFKNVIQMLIIIITIAILASDLNLFDSHLTVAPFALSSRNLGAQSSSNLISLITRESHQ